LAFPIEKVIVKIAVPRSKLEVLKDRFVVHKIQAVVHVVALGIRQYESVLTLGECMSETATHAILSSRLHLDQILEQSLGRHIVVGVGSAAKPPQPE